MKHWKTRKREPLIQDRWLCLYADECELPNGQVVAPFYVMEAKEWTHVVAIDEQGSILLTRQYRHAAGLICSELPGGVVDAGEEPLAAAQRELAEETGYAASEWTKVSALYANPNRQTNRIHGFIARRLSRVGAQSLDVSEEIEFAFVSPGEVMRRIQTGDFHSALHVASYLLAMHTLGALPQGAALPR